MSTPSTLLAPYADRETAPWRFHFLDTTDRRAVAAYEASLFRQFAPVLGVNPLIRDLWDWDDARRRMRTRVPYAKQRVALLSDRSSHEILFSIGVNVDPEAYWQSGAYGFPGPAPGEKACELLVVAGGRVPQLHGMFVVRRFIHQFLFGELVRAGFRVAFATAADHMRAPYRRVGATFLAEREVEGYRRTLIRWDLSQPAED